MKKVILATNNKDKAREIKKILNIKGASVISLPDLPQKIKVIESGSTFEENAIKKAKAVAKKFKLIAVADDSGLCVNALRGGPGVKSARYVRPPVTTEKLCRKLLEEMKKVPDDKRGAQFICCVSIAEPDGRIKVLQGMCPGIITRQMRGTGGFGYDPVFIPRGFLKTFAEMPVEDKNRISHRGRAFVKAKKTLEQMLKYGKERS